MAARKNTCAIFKALQLFTILNLSTVLTIMLCLLQNILIKITSTEVIPCFIDYREKLITPNIELEYLKITPVLAACTKTHTEPRNIIKTFILNSNGHWPETLEAKRTSSTKSI